MQASFIGRGTFGEVYKVDQYVLKVCNFLHIYNNQHTLIDNVLREATFYAYLEETINRQTSSSASTITNSTTAMFVDPPTSIPRAEIMINETNEYQIVFKMPYLGTSLSKLPNNSKSITSSVFGQILQALQWLHHNDWSHGDVKPNNILVDVTNYTSYLIDYGSLMYSSKFLLKHQRCTLFYVCPEEVCSNIVSTASDIWSFGCVLFEFVTNKIFIITLMRHMMINDEIINQFRDNANVINRQNDSSSSSTNQRFNSKQFLKQFLSGLMYSHILACIHKFIKDRDILDVLSHCFIIDNHSRISSAKLLQDFKLFELYKKPNLSTNHENSLLVTPLPSFQHLKLDGMNYEQRLSIIDTFNEFIELNHMNVNLLEFALMLYDRFLFRNPEYFKSISFKILSVPMSLIIASMILEGENYVIEECITKIKSLTSMKDFTVDSYTLIQFVLLFVQKLDFLCFNVFPSYVAHKQYSIADVVQVASEYPFIHTYINFLHHLLDQRTN
jgi:serine/threonine protein kinase